MTANSSWWPLDLFPEPIVLLTLTGTIARANTAACRLLAGSAAKSLEGLPFTKFAEVDARVLEGLLKIWGRTATMTPGRLKVRCSDGDSVEIGLEAAAARQEGHPPGILIRFREDMPFSQKMLALNQEMDALRQQVKRRVASESRLRRKQEQLKTLAHQDGLTGLANRRTFDRALQRFWSDAQQSGTGKIGLVLFDIDYFKRYNDTYGHVRGDRCLQQVARAMSRQIREGEDLLARYGGEEFVLLLRDSPEAASTVGERIVAAVRSLGIPHARSPKSVVTVSAGVGNVTPGAIDSPIRLLEMADRALYEAKRRGRDCLMGSLEENLTATTSVSVVLPILPTIGNAKTSCA